MMSYCSVLTNLLFICIGVHVFVEESDWKEVLQAKRTVEYVIQSYTHLEEAYESVLQGIVLANYGNFPTTKIAIWFKSQVC